MRHILAFVIAVVSVCPLFGQVTGAEYFIDSDPGYGKATFVNIASGNSVSKDFTLPLSAISPGFHNIGVRAKDAQSKWSLTILHNFYVVSGNAASNISTTEYFIDLDPGIGKATAIPAMVGSDSALKYAVPLTNLTPGFHSIGVRSKDNTGSWSQTILHSFYIISSKATSVTGSEYFIDADPGVGKANPVSAAFESDSALNFVVPLTSYSAGFHIMGMRSKDNQGVWSQTLQHSFYIDENSGPLNINTLQYYFTGNGATDSIYTYQVPVPSPIVDLNFKAELKQLVGDREYTMHIWAVNAKGVRGEVLIKKIKACNNEPAKAGFDFITIGTQVSFIDSSSGGSKYKWDFGDGKIDSVSNPVHNYTSGGNYSVKMIVSNFCNSDTVSKIASVVALQSVFPSNGGNKGTVTLSITGSGFTTQTTVKLKRNNIIIQASRINASNDGRSLHAVFGLEGEQTGAYDLEVQTSGSSATLISAFRLASSMAPKFGMDIIGRNAIRRNSEQFFEVKVENQSNIDAYLVPASLIVPDYVSVKPGFEIIRMESIPGLIPFGEDSITNLIHQDGKTILPILLPKIPAYSSVRFSVKLSTTTSQNELEMQVHVFNPLHQKSSNPIQQNARTKEDEPDVASACFKVSADLATDIAAKIVGKKCTTKIGIQASLYIKNIVQFIMDSNELSSEDNLKKTMAITNFIAGMEPLSNMDEIAEACFEESLKAPFKSAFKKAWGVVLSVVDVGEAAYDLGKDCIAPALPKLLQIVNSFDPNEKVGPAYARNKNHIRQGVLLNYRIFFENKNTATVPAQEVLILDTLDKSKFDLSTFQLQSYGYGGFAKAYIPEGRTEYFFVDTLHRSGKPNLLVKMDAKLDTAKGILSWRFLSIDPQTREIVEDPLDGFLPPNVTSPEGEGYISYSMMPKADLPHGTEIKNKASIYFDNNAPIVTNEFLNTLDKVSPVSSVNAVPEQVYDSTFMVQWSGSDNGAGIRSYDVYYKINDGEYQLWQYDVSLTQNSFTGQQDSTYSFFSISKDYAGNIENIKANAERTVTIKLIDTTNRVCPGSGTTFTIVGAVGYTYHWQVDMGSGFVDVANNNIYSGATNVSLTLNAPPTSYGNYQYRCKIINGENITYSKPYSIKFVSTWLGATSSAWETPANWSCGVVPDANTDVIIPKIVPATPVLNVNGTCKSITMNNSSNILLKSGATLIITGKP